MAQQTLDPTGNEHQSTLIGKLNSMLTELYSSFGGAVNPSVTTVTTSGAATIGGLLTAATAKIGTGTKTGTAVAGAVTLNKPSGVITSESLTTAAGATYTLTITNSAIAATSQVVASVALGTATGGMPAVTTVTPGSGSLVIVVQNIHASAAFDGTIKITFISLTA